MLGALIVISLTFNSWTSIKSDMCWFSQSVYRPAEGRWSFGHRGDYCVEQNQDGDSGFCSGSIVGLVFQEPDAQPVALRFPYMVNTVVCDMNRFSAVMLRLRRLHVVYFIAGRDTAAGRWSRTAESLPVFSAQQLPVWSLVLVWVLLSAVCLFCLMEDC